MTESCNGERAYQRDIVKQKRVDELEVRRFKETNINNDGSMGGWSDDERKGDDEVQ